MLRNICNEQQDCSGFARLHPDTKPCVVKERSRFRYRACLMQRIALKSISLLAGNRNNTLLEAAHFDAARMIVE
jgi:hypothetical protein